MTGWSLLCGICASYNPLEWLGCESFMLAIVGGDGGPFGKSIGCAPDKIRHASALRPWSTFTQPFAVVPADCGSSRQQPPSPHKAT